MRRSSQAASAPQKPCHFFEDAVIVPVIAFTGFLQHGAIVRSSPSTRTGLYLQRSYAVVGKVMRGMEVVDRIIARQKDGG